MKFSTTAALLAATSTTVLAAPKALMPLQLNNLHIRHNKGVHKVMVDFDLIDLNKGTSGFKCEVQLMEDHPYNEQVNKPCADALYEFGFPGGGVKNPRDLTLGARKVGDGAFYGQIEINEGAEWHCVDDSNPGGKFTECNLTGYLKIPVNLE
ncbi:uncharacterized protein BDW47DRAFT_104608 [Aspergillus candidus]|uniref:AA1-like domain-containing protein n=1 Tax=Aspergillus candidus TaxID=41067 RepID=A0A2I2FDD2_ASPCN|nr:hypothetical protein BDW47DRAFT_104608 [Aspergillus candidus]PLB38638.1 hypothetical protein BDW47DRAFT_104608 [Aspergillus candidus]